MGIRTSRANAISDFTGKLKMVPSVLRSVDGDLGRLAEESAQNMQQNIATRGTAYSASQGRAGRVETENMINAVTFRRYPKAGPTVFLWEFGWIEQWEPYFKYQEEGFVHIGSGNVEGMFALRDASTEARDRIFLIREMILAKAAKTIGR